MVESLKRLMFIMLCGFLSWAICMNSRAPNHAASAQPPRGVAHAARAARRTRAPWQRALALEGSWRDVWWWSQSIPTDGIWPWNAHTIYAYINILVGGIPTKWWSSSVGMMTFPIYGETNVPDQDIYIYIYPYNYTICCMTIVRN